MQKTKKTKKKINLSEYPEFLHEYWYELVLVKRKSQGTAEGYFIDIRTFFRYIIYMATSDDIDFKKIDVSTISIEQLDKIKLGDIYEYIFFLSDELKNNERTIARKVSSLKGMYKFLCKNKAIIKNDPTSNLEIKRPQPALPVHLSLEESQELLSQASISPVESLRDFCIVTLFLNCGLRLSELVGINISDINFNECKIRILGKGNKNRIVYLNNACINSINAYIDSRENSVIEPDALFLSKQNKRISQRRVEQIVNQLIKQCGLAGKGITVHKLRHTAATLMYQYGNVDIRKLRDVLGHESIATTQIYTHLANKDTKDAFNASPLANFSKSNGDNNDDKDDE